MDKEAKASGGSSRRTRPRMIDRVDPELVAPLEALLAATDANISLNDIPRLREVSTAASVAAQAQLPVIEEVETRDSRAPGSAGAPDVPVRVYRPTERRGPLPAMLWVHGGGYVVGSVEGNDYSTKVLARDLRCVIVSVEYRLAPEHPYPAPLEDCYAALRWVAAHATELGIRPDRIAIGGASAGGGLAAALALLARDRGEVQVAYQLLIYPMLDDRNTLPASDTVEDTLVWSREENRIGWQCYLGDRYGDPDLPVYAAPARATDLAGLPPAYVVVGGLDLFLQEDIQYATRLMDACVPTELHVYPGAYHGFDAFAPDAAVSKRSVADMRQAVSRALHG